MATLAMLAYAAVLVIGRRLLPLDSFQLLAYDDFTQAGAPLIASLCCAYAGRHSEGRIRWAWWFLAAACASWAFGDLAWTTYEILLRRTTPFPSLSDAGYLGMLPLMLIGLILLAPSNRALLRARTGLDGLSTVIAAACTVWIVALRDIYAASDTTHLEKAIGGAYPLGDLVLFFGMFIALHRQRSQRATVVLATFSAGLALFMLSDIGFAHATLNDTYVAGGVVDFGWPFGFLLMAYAATLHIAWRPNYRLDETVRRSVAWQQAMPLCLIVLAFIELEVSDRLGGADLPTVLMAGAVIGAGVVRQALVLRDNARLNADLADAGELLEARVRDRTQELRRALDERLKADAARDRLAFTLEATPDFVATADMSGRLLYLNRSARTFLGYTADQDVSDRQLVDWYPRSAMITIESEGLPIALKEGVWSGETPIVSAGGQEVPSSQVIVVHQDAAGRPQFISAIARDISQRKELEDQLRHQAFHDSLTGLANRSRFMDRLEHALQREERGTGIVAVLFIDVDRFKSINDSFGHSAGDRVLTAVAERISSCLRRADTAARFGGDEFVVLLESPLEVGEAESVALRIIETLRPPFDIDGHEVSARVSIGVNVCTTARSADDALREADVAMYVAKTNGRNRVEIYDGSMHVSVAERLALLADLQLAVERSEFIVQYQPTIELKSGRVSGFEALVRWEHPKRGIIAPLQFIPLAEESGMIIPVGRFVLREACAQTVRWNRQRAGGQPLIIAVNVSGRQLQQPGFVQDVASVLSETGLDPAWLVLEVTESVMMTDVDNMIAVLNGLKALGLRIAIDDFGTGYSSLSYLERFPFDILKIDKSFVDALDDPEREKDLTSAIVRIAKMLGLEIVAEGVERREQLDRLLTLECDLGQGYLFDRPLSVEQVNDLLAHPRAA
jgi:diguanylate cyclase (GGDEF)-like protein/PAS domain S-box-containing protein